MADFTSKAIKKAFLKLLREMPLKKITVRSITKECGITRNSFYYHYNNIPELIMEIAEEYLKEIIPKYAAERSLDKIVDDMAELLYAKRREIMHIYHSINREVFDGYLMSFSENAVKVYAKYALEGVELSEMDKRVILNFYKYELYGQLTQWLNEDLNPDIVAQFNHLCTLMPKTADILKKAGIPWYY